MGADDPLSAPEQMRPYQEAKAAADEALRDSGLDFTIVRPGRLTDDPGTGLVDAAPSWVAAARYRATMSPPSCCRARRAVDDRQ